MVYYEHLEPSLDRPSRRSRPRYRRRRRTRHRPRKHRRRGEFTPRSCPYRRTLSSEASVSLYAPMQFEDAETIANLIRAEPDASFGHSRFPYSAILLADWYGEMAAKKTRPGTSSSAWSDAKRAS